MVNRAVVVGAGPNGLTAACVLARMGLQVEVLEANATIGGAASTAELTLPGFRHDVGSSAYPMGAASPVWRSMPLEQFGLRWVHAGAPMAHVLDGAGRDGDGEGVVLERSLEATADGLGREDGAAYRRLMRPLVEGWEELAPELLGPPVHLPRHPWLLARFGLGAVQPMTLLAKELFRGERGRALFAGMAGHSVMPLERPLSAAVALVLGAAAHAVGWPVAAGGGQAISEALAGYLRSLGGVIRTGVRVRSLRELPQAEVVLCDVMPRALAAMAEGELTTSYAKLLRRYSYGPGMFKLDWALDGPIPWRHEGARRAGTVHAGGTLEEVAASERAPWRGEVADRPFLIVVQPAVADRTRAPEGKATAWGYCHVPNGWEGDATAPIERQMERFAPGFGRQVLARKAWGTRALESWNANLIGGDVSGGAMSAWQMAMRPTPRLYETSKAGLYLCSSATPPGGGAHGMCGFHAARAALRWLGRS